GAEAAGAMARLMATARTRRRTEVIMAIPMVLHLGFGFDASFGVPQSPCHRRRSPDLCVATDNWHPRHGRPPELGEETAV
ncbi:MAG: hypothetical protein ACREKJ_18000, partial [Candidatus Rokuibacteriota bacterium]